MELNLWTLSQIQHALMLLSDALINLNGENVSFYIHSLIEMLESINPHQPINFLINYTQYMYNNSHSFIERWTLNFPCSLDLDINGVYRLFLLRFVNSYPNNVYNSFIPPTATLIEDGDFAFTRYYPGSAKVLIIQKHFTTGTNAVSVNHTTPFNALLNI